MADYDVIVVGAGHNGLAAATVLAKNGLKVLDLEKNSYVGGQAATRELIKGFKHNVGAWALMMLRNEVAEALELKKYGGYEVIDPATSTCTFGEPGQKPYIVYNDPVKMMQCLTEDHGPEAVQGLTKLLDLSRTFAEPIDAIRFSHPKSFGAIMDSMPTPQAKDIMRKWFFGSAVDIINECFPDPNKFRSIRGSIAGMAVDGTGRGPYSPGTAFSLAYHIVTAGVGGTYQLVKGGMGQISEALKKSFKDKGGEIRLSATVKRILVEKGKAIGVELANGEKISAKIVLSNLDAYATFIRLVGEHVLPVDFVDMVKKIKYGNPYLEIHVALKELPEFVGDMAFLNEDKLRWFVGYYPSPEYLERCYQDCRLGRVPRDPLSSYYIPSMWDDTMAPKGYYTATFFSQYFPIAASRDQHGRLKDEMAEKVINKMAEYAPNLKGAIMDKVIFAPYHYEAMFGLTEGDYASGLMIPEQMLDCRPVVGWAEYKTPIDNLYLCGACCHPGPGVTAVPGYNCANEVLKAWKKTGGV